MGNVQTVGPNEALIVSGGWCGNTGKKMVVGGWAWAWWMVTDVQRLSLEVMTLTPRCEHVETAQGVPLTVTGVAQCKVMTEREFLATAAEQFLGKPVDHIKSVIRQTLEGHLRAILGTLSVEEVYRDRDQFASLRDADVGVAQANRDAGIREAECEKAAMDVKYGANTKIEDSHRLFQLQKSNFDAEVNTKKAEAQLSYELQAAKMKQKIRSEEIEIDVVERRKLIAVEEKEILRKEKELTAIVRLPAEAEAYKVELLAQGKRTQTMDVARAEAEKIKLVGMADAYAIESVGKAEAEGMRMKAAAYKQYGDAAVMSLVLDALPKIAAEISAPLAKTEDIILIGGSDHVTS
ncbi:hypothetical protein CEXT_516461 [Caerostris extrusa]|uniref:Flotillin n=1 Tax=Caerostris extrusa TaxID=172846 RepID=A0AAV4SH61_CAEEX|nr:hypothetical protein CEXT_516461 [Caerostris extrusa]